MGFKLSTIWKALCGTPLDIGPLSSARTRARIRHNRAYTHAGTVSILVNQNTLGPADIQALMPECRLSGRFCFNNLPDANSRSISKEYSS